jgi:hypothetical protein
MTFPGDIDYEQQRTVFRMWRTRLGLTQAVRRGA